MENDKISPFIKPNTEVWCSALEKSKEKIQDPFFLCKIISFDQEKENYSIQSIANPDETISVAENEVFLLNEYSENGFEDMVQMEHLNEAELLNNIKKRFEKNIIFTYVGPTLIALNPYMKIPDLFSEDNLTKYQNNIYNPQFSLKDFPPHIYAISGMAYKQLIENKKNQAIVISGESGAGKTEETKYAMKFLTTLGKNKDFYKINLLVPMEIRKRASYFLMPEEKEDMGVEEKILSCNPILEAFGNAKTVRNDNSSRFGKLVLLMVDKSSKKVKGALITNYLLEKSRVISQSQAERNYHIFYYLFKGANKDLLEDLNLGDMKNYDYLKKNNCFSVSTINDQESFMEVAKSLETLRFKVDEIKSIWKILGAVLHLGNTEFSEKTLDTNTNKPCSILQLIELQKASEILSIDDQKLINAICFKTRKIGTQVINSPMNRIECVSVRDAFTKTLYENLFNWIVKRLNNAITFDKNLKFEDIISDKSRFSIGILDIFGFEVFKTNSLEQFCINFTNEKLQQLYISYVFKAEMNEFVMEGLKDYICELNYKDNQSLIDLFEMSPQGIFNLLDESCSVSSNDDSLLNTIIKYQKSNENLKIPKIIKGTFIVVHSAKDVEYTVNGFRVKNKDELPENINELMSQTMNPIIFNIFYNKLGEETKMENGITEENDQVKVKKGKTNADKFLTAKFRIQIKELMNELNSSDCHFIRCIKPNEQKQKNSFISQLILQQIRYLGVLDSIKIRKESFPIRTQFMKFFQKFYELHPDASKMSYSEVMKEDKGKDYKLLCRELAKKAMPDAGKNKILFGDRKVFMKIETSNILEYTLEQKRKIKHEKATKIQRTFFRYNQRKKLKNLIKAIKTLQNKQRCRLEYKNFKKTLGKIRKIQKFFKKKLFVKKAKIYFSKIAKVRKMVTKLRAYFQRKRAQKKYKTIKKSAKIMIRVIRGFLSRCYARKIKFNRKIAVATFKFPFFDNFKKNEIFNKAWAIIRRRWEIEAAIVIQKVARVYLTIIKHWKKVQKIRKTKQETKERIAVVKIQKRARIYICHQINKRRHRAVNKIQGFVKMQWLSFLFQVLRKSVKKIQRVAKRFLLIRKKMNEKWREFNENEMFRFERLKELESKTLFGLIENHNLYKNNQSIFSTHKKNNSFANEKTEKKEKYLQPENEEEFLNLLENEQKAFHNCQFPSDTLFDDMGETKLIEDLVGYLPTEEKDGSNSDNNEIKVVSQKPNPPVSEAIYDVDLNRKIVLFMIILDFELLADTSDLYKPTWSSLYHKIRKEQAQMDSSLQVIEVGETFSLTVSETGKIFTWGANDYFQLGKTSCNDEDENGFAVTVPLENGVKPRKIIAGDNHSFLIDQNNDVYCWGDNFIGQLGLSDNRIHHKLNQNKILPQKKMRDICSKGILNVGLTEDGKVLIWPFQKTNGSFIFKPVEIPLKNDVVISSIACGNNFVILLSNTGLVYSFGKENYDGQLGQNDKEPRNLPTLISSLKSTGEKIVSVSCGFKHVLCKSNLGKVFLWGAGSDGQLGFDSLENEYSPKQLNLEKYLHVSKNTLKTLQAKAGFRCSIILLENRRIYWWGTNSILKQMPTPQKLDYTLYLQLAENENPIDYIPIRLWTTWSKTKSIIYMTIADTTRVQSNLILKQKLCSTLTTKWDDQSIDPPLLESFARNFTTKSVRKNILKTPERPMKKNVSSLKISKQCSPKKLTEKEKATLLEVFALSGDKVAHKNASNNNLMRTRSKSPMIKENLDEEKLKTLKIRFYNLIKTSKEMWLPSDFELMKKLSESSVSKLIKKI